MGISERREHIIDQINAINDEATLSVLEEAVGYYAKINQRDVTEGLSEEDLQELKTIAEEPFDKDTISEEEFKQQVARWRTK